jgi:hypothetical protein
MNPHRTAQGYIEDCRPIPIVDLVRLGIIKQHTRKTDSYSVPAFDDPRNAIPITIASDLRSTEGNMTIAGQEWKLRAINQSRHGMDGNPEEMLEWFVVGSDGKRYSFLYLTPNYQIGTRKSLRLVYRSQHLKPTERVLATTTKRIHRARRRLRPALDPDISPAEELISVGGDIPKRRWQWASTWYRTVAQIEALKAKAAGIINGTWEGVVRKIRKARSNIAARTDTIVAHLEQQISTPEKPIEYPFGGVVYQSWGEILKFYDPQPTAVLEDYRQKLIDAFPLVLHNVEPIPGPERPDDGCILDLVVAEDYWRIKEITEHRWKQGLATNFPELRLLLMEERLERKYVATGWTPKRPSLNPPIKTRVVPTPTETQVLVETENGWISLQQWEAERKARSEAS